VARIPWYVCPALPQLPVFGLKCFAHPGEHQWQPGKGSLTQRPLNANSDVFIHDHGDAEGHFPDQLQHRARQEGIHLQVELRRDCLHDQAPLGCCQEAFVTGLQRETCGSACLCLSMQHSRPTCACRCSSGSACACGNGHRQARWRLEDHICTHPSRERRLRVCMPTVTHAKMKPTDNQQRQRQPRVPSTSECRFNKSPHHQKNRDSNPTILPM